MQNIFVDYEPHKGRVGNTFYNAVEEGLSKFINNKELLYRNLPETESRNSGNHIETSYLNHGIWTKSLKQISSGQPRNKGHSK